MSLSLEPNAVCRVTSGKYKNLPVRLIEQVTATAWSCLPNGLDQPRLTIKSEHLKRLP